MSTYLRKCTRNVVDKSHYDFSITVQFAATYVPIKWIYPLEAVHDVFIWCINAMIMINVNKISNFIHF